MRYVHEGRIPRVRALRCLSPLFVSLLFVLATPSALADDNVVIYRCVDAKGAVTFQNDTPCPKGSKQQRKVMEPSPVPTKPHVPDATAVARPKPDADSRPKAEPKIEPAQPVARSAPRPAPPPLAPIEPPPAYGDEAPLPPPVLYECRTYDDDSYLSENGTPQQRCVTLNTTGLGGISSAGAGAACEMKTDRCQRVPDGALCDSWRRRLREAESALRFGVVEDRAFAQSEIERIGRIVRESACSRE